MSMTGIILAAVVVGGTGLFIGVPAQEQAGKESCQRKEYLTRNEVEPTEQGAYLGISTYL